jgi:hypothetical protein
LIALDHLIVAANALDAGAQWLEPKLGAALQPGGQHIGWGTHNRLMQLGGGTYLELIAPDPSQPEPSAPRPFGLDAPGLRASLVSRPRLIHFALRTDELDTLLPGLLYDPGRISAMSRGNLKWRITLPDSGRPLAGGLLPTLVQWDVDETPPMRLPQQGVSLTRLEVRLPAEWFAAMPALDDARVVVMQDRGDGEPALRAVLATPGGECVIES